ncbi:type II secretion system F family protein [Kitasatospora sp. NPDC002227]|uniref:type II secretion system F family protein n=1 Tax=Kitasatospora sp. NPDC002227 TaxID=3154773 RepID=UPI003333D7C0
MSDVLSPFMMLALLAGLGVGGGIALLVAAIVGWPRKAGSGQSTGQQLAGFLRRRGAAAVLVGLVVLVLLRWPVAAIAAGLLVMFWSQLFGGLKGEKAALAKVEALATWTESLRDTVAGSAGLEQAIAVSARNAADVLKPHLDRLDFRVRTRMPLPDALDLLADDINDGGADEVIAALKQSASLRGAGLKQVLTDLAHKARSDVGMRRRIMTSRSPTRRSVQIVTAVIVAIVTGLRVFNPSYTQPYASVQGQLVLAVVFFFFAGSLAWLRRLAKVPEPARFLVRVRAGGVR